MGIVGTLIGLALATTVATVVISAVGGKLVNWPLQWNGNKSSEELIDPNGSKVQFVLFTRQFQPHNIKFGTADDSYNFVNSGFNASNPTKIIIHGYLSSIKEDVFVLNKNAYLETGDYNVIGMDWSALCEFEYLSATRGVRIAGRYLGEFLNWLEQMGVPLETIHIIGHSMGAHVAGVAGGRVGKGRIARITGLDPARPGFENARIEHKLDHEDASLVDVVHTYVRLLSLQSPIGHIDFYPNGGRFQPGCPDFTEIWKVTESLLCNHGRAYHLFAESIRNKRSFKSYKCKSIVDAFNGRCTEEMDVFMGQPDTYQNGIYFFQTKDKAPYSLSK